MADIELVIKIPENMWDQKKKGYVPLGISKYLKNGTPLPKGHGDLIDMNDLLKHHDSTTYHNGIEERKIHFVQIGYVIYAPTIIEADTESEEE